jgi:cephalosporin-C deacetylase-like acetyl esterase
MEMFIRSRREFLKSSAAFALTASPTASALAQINVQPPQLYTTYQNSYANEFPDMLVSYLTKRLNALAAQWDDVRDRIKSAQQAEARNDYVRRSTQQMIGPFPARTLLNAVVTKTLERDGYRIENVMYESRPNLWVTSNLYVPTTAKGPFPGILSPNGHYEDAGREPSYQEAHLDLVKSGFVVLSPDPIGQGERRQFWDSTSRKWSGSTIDEHSIFGQLLWLVGDSLAQYKIWDGIRGIDYLQSRSEVDPSRIGCTGHSGGGRESLWISVLDARVKCAACIEPMGYHFWPVTAPPGTYLYPGDAEHDWFPAASMGIDGCDLFQAIAPRPLLIGVETYADQRFQLAAKHVRARYELFKAENKFATVEATDAHYWTDKLRLAATDWFCRWLYDRPGPTAESQLVIEPVENLFCTPTGSLIDSRQGDTLQSILLKKQETLPPARPVPTSPSELTSYSREMQELVRTSLRCTKIDQPFAVRHLARTPRVGFHIEKLEFLSEREIYIPAWVFIPEEKKPGARPILYLGDTDAEAVGYPESGWGDQLARKGHVVLAVDVRGMGQTRPLHHSYFENRPWGNLFDVEAALAYGAWAMNESLLGMRVCDAIRSVDYASSRPDINLSELVVIGSGMGALWGLYAALLDPRIEFVIADSGLVSYQCLVQSDRYSHGADVMILEVLKHFDLPQVVAALAGRRVALVSPVGPMKEPVTTAEALIAYQFARRTYDACTSAERFQIFERNSDISPAAQYSLVMSQMS